MKIENAPFEDTARFFIIVDSQAKDMIYVRSKRSKVLHKQNILLAVIYFSISKKYGDDD